MSAPLSAGTRGPVTELQGDRLLHFGGAACHYRGGLHRADEPPSRDRPINIQALDGSGVACDSSAILSLGFCVSRGGGCP